MPYEDILDKVGNTPLVEIKPKELAGVINLYAKLELFNPTGSVKDRPASYIIKTILRKKEVLKDTLIIESSSGNLGISLAAYCKKYRLRFLCIVDPHISPINEFLIRKMGGSVIKVIQQDHNGGYLLNRIKRVKQILKKVKNSYWVNQYANPYNAAAYYNTLGVEICKAFQNIDYVFMGVSSGGTITGVSQRVKKTFPECKIIAVDIIGSRIFGGLPQKRYIPGIGSSMTPKILQNAYIDEVVRVNELSTIKMCHELLSEHCIFAGGSSGSAFAAVKKYFKGKKFKRKPTVVTIFPDKGDRYIDTVYNEKWCRNFVKNYNKLKNIKS